MSVRLAKRREGVVALTHTEIMLVLATVILLLLLAKNIDLTDAKKDLKKEQEKISALEAQANESANDALERKEQADFAQEVKAILINGGVAEENAEPARLAAAVSVLVAESRRDEARDNAVNEALIQAGMLEDVGDDSDKKDDLAAQKIKQMGENAAIGKAVRETLGEDAINPEIAGEQIAEWKHVADSIVNQNLDDEKLTGEEQRIKDLKKEVGFLPCWLGDKSPRYYLTYNLTYFPRADQFKIARHRHWDAKVTTVSDALSGGLAVLKEYPRKMVSRKVFLAFARRVDNAKNRLYGNNGCRLAVTINKRGVDLTVTNDFIFGRAGFYPIGRNSR